MRTSRYIGVVDLLHFPTILPVISTSFPLSPYHRHSFILSIMKLTLFGAALAAMAPIASLAAPIVARQSKGPIGYASMSTESSNAYQNL